VCQTPVVSTLQAIASEVSRALDAAVGSGAAADAALNTWVGAFMSTVFNEANVEKRVSVVPYMEVLPGTGMIKHSHGVEVDVKKICKVCCGLKSVRTCMFCADHSGAERPMEGPDTRQGHTGGEHSNERATSVEQIC
jgi:hypothetical protein